MLGILLSRVRVEEKLLLAAFKSRRIPVEIIDDRQIVFDLPVRNWQEFHGILERCINHSRALYALRIFNDWGIPTVNCYEVALVCGNKLETTSALARNGVPVPRCSVAFTPESALRAIEDLGYPYGNFGAGWDLNDAGVVVGESRDNTGSDLPSVWTLEDGIQQLPVPADWGAGAAMGINETGTITGHVFDASGSMQAVIWVELPSIPATPEALMAEVVASLTELIQAGNLPANNADALIKKVELAAKKLAKKIKMEVTVVRSRRKTKKYYLAAPAYGMPAPKSSDFVATLTP